jgi:hypothetical protein
MGKNRAAPSYTPWILNTHEKRFLGKRVESLREIYGRGEKDAIMEGLYLCILCGFPIPEWLARAYIDAYSKVNRLLARSWDDVFGRPHPKGTNLLSKRKKLEAGLLIFCRISYIKNRWPQIPVNEELFERVGEDVARKIGLQKPLKKTFVSECYSEFKKSSSQPFSWENLSPKPIFK